MITINDERFFTIDEVVKLSGYQKNTIYNFTTEQVISSPVKGLTEASYQSQGLYRETVFNELLKYKELKLTGLKKCDIIEHIKAMRTNNEPLLSLLEARR